MHMENIRLKVSKASFTVEAVFVVTIVIWIVAAVCYLSVYSHDEAALYTLTQNFLELAVENGKDLKESEVQIGLRKYLEEHLILTRTKQVGVKKKLRFVYADIEYYADVRFPFASMLLPAARGKQIRISHEKLFAPDYMWDCEAVKEGIKDE